MREMQCFFLLSAVLAAVVFDLKKDRIPNWLILCGLAAGWSTQLIKEQILGIFLFFGGAGIPILAGAFIYYFRMMGAGDIKLLAVAGGFMGPGKVIFCMAASLFAGGILAVLLLLKRRNLKERIFYLFHYIAEQKRTGEWKPYITEKDQGGRMHFSIAILAGILLYVGGVY